MPPRQYTYTRNLDQITAWVDPKLGLKERLRRIHAIDHRQTQSRITEDALRMYVPILEKRLEAEFRNMMAAKPRIIVRRAEQEDA